MSDIVKMSVEPRPGVGKGAARAARRAGYVPGVIYGDKKDPVTIQLKGNELLKTLNNGGFYTTIFDIDVAGEHHRVIPKDIQKNKLNGLPEHVDFMRLTKGAKIQVMIPVEFLNEEECPGLKQGGTLNVVRHEVELSVLPDNMPENIQIDLSAFEIGASINISDAAMPEGAEPTITDRDFTIATIIEPRAAVEEDEDTEAPETEVTAQGGDDAAEGDSEES
jgi:large subunit ribosomal protein L25